MKESETATVHPRWDLGQLRHDVQRVFGQMQRDAVAPCLNTIVERRFNARLFYYEAKDLLDEDLRDYQHDMNLVSRVLGGFDADKGSFEEVRMRAAAKINACLHAMHSLPDILGQTIYLALGMNRHPATELPERYTSIYSVRDKLPLGSLRSIIEQLIDHSDFVYLSALNNMSKHRAIVPIDYSVDMTGEDAEGHGLKFSDFIYGTTHYPARWVRPFLIAEYQRQECLVMESGLALNAELAKM